MSGRQKGSAFFKRYPKCRTRMEGAIIYVCISILFQLIFGGLTPAFATPDLNPQIDVPVESVDVRTEADARAEADAFYRDKVEGAGSPSDSLSSSLDTWGLFDLEGFEVSRPAPSYRNLTANLAHDTQKLELSSEGRVVFRTKSAVLAAKIFGNYLVFLEPLKYIGDVQYLTFVDLKQYEPLLGTKSTPPLFHAPIHCPSAPEELRVANGHLQLFSKDGQSTQVPTEVLATWSDGNQVLMNVDANLLNPETYDSAGPTVEETEYYLLKVAKTAARNNPVQLERAENFAKDLQTRLEKRKERNAPQTTIAEAEKTLGDSQDFKNTIAAIQKQIASQRRLTARLQMLWRRLSFPRPLDAPMQIREAIAMTVAGLRTTGRAREVLVQEGTLQLIANPWLKFGAGIAAAATLGVLYPEQTAQFAYRVLDLGRSVVGSATGMVRGLVSLTGYATKITASGFKPSVFYDAYLQGDKLPHFLTGITALFVSGALVLGIPIVMTNAWLLARDFKKMGHASVDLFIQRQRKLLTEYLRAQTNSFAKMAAHHGQGTQTQFTSEDDAEVQTILDQIEARKNSFVKKMVNKVSEWKLFRRSTHEESSDEEDDAPDLASPPKSQSSEELVAEKQIYNFRTALSNFLFGYSSLTPAFTKFVHAWNGFTIFRMIFWSPTLWYVQATYPNYINSAFGDGSNTGVQLPTRANGGRMGPLGTIARVAKIMAMDSDIEVVRKWESKIIPVEQALIAEALKEGYRALAQYIREEGGDMRELIRMGTVRSITDERITTLSLRYRTFFRLYVESILERGLSAYLEKLLRDQGEEAIPESMGIDELKRKTLAHVDALELDTTKAPAYIELATAGGRAYQEATETSKLWANDARAFFKTISINLRHNALSIVDPDKSATPKRVQVVLKMLQKADSMPRAVRSSISQLLMSKFIGLPLSLFGLAGITDGVLQPLHNEMFGPNSYFYMGRAPFVGGLLLPLGIGLFANAFSKLQTDYAHADHFGEVPEGEDAEKGIASWYYKQTFKNKLNTWWINQRTQTQIMWGNMKPAFV